MCSRLTDRGITWVSGWFARVGIETTIFFITAPVRACLFTFAFAVLASCYFIVAAGTFTSGSFLNANAVCADIGIFTLRIISAGFCFWDTFIENTGLVYGAITGLSCSLICTIARR